MRGLPVHRRVEALVERRPLRRSDLNRDEALGFAPNALAALTDRDPPAERRGPKPKLGMKLGN
jgi:hypothetical protein